MLLRHICFLVFPILLNIIKQVRQLILRISEVSLAPSSFHCGFNRSFCDKISLFKYRCKIKLKRLFQFWRLVYKCQPCERSFDQSPKWNFSWSIFVIWFKILKFLIHISVKEYPLWWINSDSKDMNVRWSYLFLPNSRSWRHWYKTWE